MDKLAFFFYLLLLTNLESETPFSNFGLVTGYFILVGIPTIFPKLFINQIKEHLDNMAAASYGMTDTMGRMHGDAQFAGSSSVPAHVEMMGFLGMGNNPMVGATVAVAVAIEEAMK